MTILYALVPMALVLCLLAVWAFFWAVNTGQFEDLDSAADSPLEDDLQNDLRNESGASSPAPSAPGAPPSG
jgi:cbb3-type cytochrome oxidase maturation protein